MSIMPLETTSRSRFVWC